jgi:hypothetical protein
MQYENNP